MNISKIISMYDSGPDGEAPELHEEPPNVAGFRDRMNVENVNQTIMAPVIVQQAQEIITSIAKLHGGPCTNADIRAAGDIVKARPLQTDAEVRFEKVRIAILSGEITTLQQLKDKFIE